MKINTIVSLVFVATGFLSCKDSAKPETVSTYELVWNDEFDQAETQIDTSKWFLETEAPNNGAWYNNELQHYTDRLDNVYVSDGTLKIVAKKEDYTHSGTTQAYTSSRLNSKFKFTYGRVEVRAKLPRAQGTWPAIWMLGENLTTAGWPACGEIDIMEQLFEDFLMVQCAIHVPASYGDTPVLKQFNVSDVTENFHVYGVEWTPKELLFFVDDTFYFTYAPEEKNDANWPFYSNQFILLNIAMGGNLGGTVAPDFTQDAMEVDFVRVYQKK